jgi:phage terminase Nu1 subunit (DNA packaging protein)
MTSALVTRREIAGILGVHMMTVTKWEQTGMPVREPGRKGKPSLYSEADVRAWLEAREEAARNGTGGLNPLQQRARKDLAQAMLAEQTLEERAGNLLRRDDVEKSRAAEIAGVRSKILSWPMTIAPALHREAALHGRVGVERVLQHAVEELLRDLAEPEPKPPKKKARKKKSAKKAAKKKSTRK